MHISIKILLCLLLLSNTTLFAHELLSDEQTMSTWIGPSEVGQWHLASKKGGAKVWTRDIENSRVKEVKLTATIDVPVEQVWLAITDVASYPDFMPYVSQIDIIDKITTDSAYVYHKVDPPLVSQRDYTLLITNEIDLENGSYYRYWTQKNHAGPTPQKGIVRLEICDGSWALDRTLDNQTEITYWVYTDPGGKIPTWLANKANTVGLYEILEAVEKRAKRLNE